MEYGFGMPFLSDRPVGEDAFYMLTIAWNIAAEGRIAYNLDIATTGIQPLSTFVYAAVAKVVQWCGGDKWALVRAVTMLNVALVPLFAVLLRNIVRHLLSERDAKATASALAVVTVLSSMWVFRAFTYGLETGYYLVLFAATVLFTLRAERLEPVALGCLAGLTCLSRIDFGLVFGLQLLWLMRERRLDLKGALVSGGIALTVVAPWFLWVHSTTGHFMPSSGSAQAGLISAAGAVERMRWMAKGLLWNVSPWITSWDFDMQGHPALLALVAVLGLSLPAAYRAHRTGAIALNPRALRALLSWGGCVVPLIPIYLGLFWAQHFYGRYTAPLLVLVIPAIAVLVTAAGQRRRWLPGALLAASPVAFVVLAVTQLHSGHMVLDFPVNAGFVAEELGAGHLVGASQSGALGYFNENVLNLDGKIDPRALASRKDGKIHEYVDAQRADILIDWLPLCLDIIKAYPSSEWQECDKQPDGRSTCFMRASLGSASSRTSGDTRD